MNPDNGPGTSASSDYQRAVNDFRAAGGKVLGYVYTCYGRSNCVAGLPTIRTTSDVLADSQRYADWHNLDGIFLDEMSNNLGQLPFYQTVARGLRSGHPHWTVFANPGTSAPREYLTVADTLVTFEHGTGSYVGAATEPWMAIEPASRQAHLHYNVQNATFMIDLLAQARARNVGYVYITNDQLPNPWDSLPPYFSQELAALTTPVPEPTTWAMLLASIGVLAVRWRARGPQSALRGCTIAIATHYSAAAIGALFDGVHRIAASLSTSMLTTLRAPGAPSAANASATPRALQQKN